MPFEQMDSEQIKVLIFLLVGLGTGAYLFFDGFKLRRKHKMIENIPTSKVRSVAMGLAEVSGLAQVKDRALISPFAKKECVYYKYKVEERRGSGKNSRWVTIASEASQDFFYLTDDTGALLVAPYGAECHLNKDHQYGTGIFNSGNSHQLFQGLKDMGIDTRGFLGFNKMLRADEFYIQPGDFVYVMGSVQSIRETGGDHTTKDAIMIGRESNRIFIMSDKSEKKLVSSLKIKAGFYLAGGPILAVFCLACLLDMFGLINWIGY